MKQKTMNKTSSSPRAGGLAPGARGPVPRDRPPPPGLAANQGAGAGRIQFHSIPRRGSTTVSMALQKAPPRRISPCPARRAPGGPPEGPPGGGGAPLGLVPGLGQCPPRGPGTSAPRLKPPHIPPWDSHDSAVLSAPRLGKPGKAWESLGKPGKAWESLG